MRPASLALALLLAACGSGRDRPAFDPSAIPGVEAPAMRADTLWIEGEPEPFEMRRFVAHARFPVPFWTYVPPDWRAGPDGEAVRFVPDGPLAREVELRVEAYPNGTTEQEAIRRLDERAAEMARRRGQIAVLSEEPLQPWALRAIVFADGELGGEVLLARHGGRFVEFATRYPLEAGDGFAPRMQYVFDRWRWADGGALQAE